MNYSSPDWAGMLIVATVIFSATALVWWSLRCHRDLFTPARTAREASRLYRQALAQAPDWGRPLTCIERRRWEAIRTALISGQQMDEVP